jgi:hypothetical protein
MIIEYKLIDPESPERKLIIKLDGNKVLEIKEK